MSAFQTFALSTVATGIAYGLYKVVYGHLYSALRYLPGPPSPSFLFGNLKQLGEGDICTILEQWIGQYGPTIRFGLFFNVPPLMPEGVLLLKLASLTGWTARNT